MLLEEVQHGKQGKGLWEHKPGTSKWSGKMTPRKGLLRCGQEWTSLKQVNMGQKEGVFSSQGRTGTRAQTKSKRDTFKEQKIQVGRLVHKGKKDECHKTKGRSWVS